MKKILFLIISIALCNFSAYAKHETITYKYTVGSGLFGLLTEIDSNNYMVIEGNFNKRTLTDGDVSIKLYHPSGNSSYYLEIKGKYEKGELIGTIKYEGCIFEVQGSISNNKNGSISTRCKPSEWRCDMRAKVIPIYREDDCKVSVTSPLAFETSIKITERDLEYEYFLTVWQRKLKEAINYIAEKEDQRFTTLTFSDKLIYEGPVEMRQNSGSIHIPYGKSPCQVKLTWANGDTFEGHLNGDRPYHGTIKYHDGQTFEYDCYEWNDFKFAKFKIDNNGLCVSPSEMKENFEVTIRKREAARLRKIRMEEERKAAELRAKQEEEAKKMARSKNELIRKYGQRYGEAIFNGEPKIGMTIEMIQTIHDSTGSISRYIKNGVEITKLSFGGGYFAMFGVAGREKKYEYTFVNGKLEEYYSEDGNINVLTM